MGTNLFKLITFIKYNFTLHFLRLVNFTGLNIIVRKKLFETDFFLYYPKWEHLLFLFKPTLTYEKYIQDHLKKIINKNDLIFDIGANIGQYSLFFSHLLSGKNGKVISIEPDPNNFGILCLNKYRNHCLNIHLLNIGIGNYFEILPLSQDLVTGGRTSNFLSKAKSNILIEIRPLSWLINEFGTPNFIKIDVEGFEKAILEGVPDTVSLNNIIFLIEVRYDTKNVCFNKLKTTHKCLLIDKKTTTEILTFEQIPDFANLLFIPFNV